MTHTFPTRRRVLKMPATRLSLQGHTRLSRLAARQTKGLGNLKRSETRVWIVVYKHQPVGGLESNRGTHDPERNLQFTFETAISVSNFKVSRSRSQNQHIGVIAASLLHFLQSLTDESQRVMHTTPSNSRTSWTRLEDARISPLHISYISYISYIR